MNLNKILNLSELYVLRRLTMSIMKSLTAVFQQWCCSHSGSQQLLVIYMFLPQRDYLVEERCCLSLNVV